MSAPGVLLSSLSMDSAQDGWAMGITEPSDNNRANSRATSPTPVSGTTAQALFYHYTQGRWQRSLVKLPASGGSNFAPVIGKLSRDSPSDGWMLGAAFINIPVGSAYHFAQGCWLPATLPRLSTPRGWELDGVYFQKDGSG
jgi:hypothetical protein